MALDAERPLNLSYLSPEVPFEVGADSSITDATLLEVGNLQRMGLDIHLAQNLDPFCPETKRQAMIDQGVGLLEASPTGAAEFRAYPALGPWAQLAKRAIALQTLYNPEAGLVGEGIDPAVYRLPLFKGKSAVELLHEQRGSAKADKIVAAYDTFVSTEIDDGTESVLGSRDFFLGVKDAEAVRSRAAAATLMVNSHIEGSALLKSRQDLVSASLACGAAGPVYGLVNTLGARGHNFSKVTLVDQDTMALATALALAEGAGVQDKIDLQHRNLITEKLTDYILPHSVDVVDLLGLFEYIPNTSEMPMAAELLKQVKDIVRPGGMIVFGNMLKHRPQQKFFSEVVQWPNLQQRGIRETLYIASQAGFDPKQVEVQIPQEGVYAVYGVKVPELHASELAGEPLARRLGVASVEQY